MSTPFRLEPLDASHDRSEFACGDEALDRYFRSQVSQDTRRRIANCYIAVETATGTVAGYYTIAVASVAIHELPAEMTCRLPRYPSVPAVHIGRLGVDNRFHGCGLGSALLADALHRSANAAVAAYALLVDAKNDAAAAFYRHHEFVALVERPRSLILPIATSLKLFRKE